MENSDQLWAYLCPGLGLRYSRAAKVKFRSIDSADWSILQVNESDSSRPARSAASLNCNSYYSTTDDVTLNVRQEASNKLLASKAAKLKTKTVSRNYAIIVRTVFVAQPSSPEQKPLRKWEKLNNSSNACELFCSLFSVFWVPPPRLFSSVQFSSSWVN